MVVTRFCMHAAGKTSLCQPTTPVTTPARASAKPNLASLTVTSSGRHHAGLSTGRSPSAERASSIGAKGPRKDTRPLIDKTYQMMLLNKIDDFFRMTQRSTMLNSNGSLKPITLKMFVEVSSFLLKVFEIKQELTIANYVEELPRCARKLHYPGLMTKSWLKTANAMHSWPYVLGWIGWLVEACQVRELAFDRYQLETLPFLGTEQQAHSCKMELLALLDGYKSWNDEKLEEEAELLEKYLRDIEIQQGVTEEDVAQTRRELMEENPKLQTMEEESRKVDQAVERSKDDLSSLYAKDAKELNDIKTKEEYIKKSTTETNQLNAEHNILNEQIQIGNEQREKLISIVRNQPMSRIDKEKIMKKCTEIQNYIYEFDEHLKDYQKEIYTLDIKFSSINNNLNKALLAYNKEIFMYNDIGVNFDELKLPEKGLLNPEIMEIFEEKVDLMKSFKESLMKRCNDTKSLVCSDTMKLEKLQEKIKSLPDDKKLKEEKSHVDKMKTDAKREKAKLTEQVEMLRNEMREIQNPMPDLRAVELEIEEAKDKLDAVTRRKTFLEQSAKRFFDEFYKIIGKHRNELHELFTKNIKI